MKQLVTVLFAALIFLVPSNLFYSITTQQAYVRGVLVDYLIPKIYLADIILVLFCTATLYTQKNASEKIPKNIFDWVIGTLCAVLIAFQIQTPNLPATIFGVWQLVKIFCFVYCLRRVPFIATSAITRWAVVVTVLFQGVVGMYQFWTQQSVFGYLFLGEPELTYSLGLAREVVNGSERLLPYGTTAHPNVLGGILACFLIIMTLQISHFTKGKWWQILLYTIAQVVGIITLWATQSVSAWMAYTVGILILIYQYTRNVTVRLYIPQAAFIIAAVILSLIVPILLAQYANKQLYLPSSSIDRRVVLQEAAITMLTTHPIAGVGLNQFTLNLETVAPSREIIRFIQPAHSLLLLWLSETGGVGLLLLASYIWYSWEKRFNISALTLLLLPIAVLDHYLLTLHSGLLLTTIYISYLQYSSDKT